MECFQKWCTLDFSESKTLWERFYCMSGIHLCLQTRFVQFQSEMMCVPVLDIVILHVVVLLLLFLFKITQNLCYCTVAFLLNIKIFSTEPLLTQGVVSCVCENSWKPTVSETSYCSYAHELLILMVPKSFYMYTEFAL